MGREDVDERPREVVDPGLAALLGPAVEPDRLAADLCRAGRDPAPGRAALGGTDRPAGAGAAVHAGLGRGAMTAVTAAEWARRVRAREVRVVDVAEETLDAIRREDGVIRAFTAVDEDAVRRDARRLDRRLAGWRRPRTARRRADRDQGPDRRPRPPLVVRLGGVRPVRRRRATRRWSAGCARPVR